MVRKIGQFLPPTPPTPSLCLILEPIRQVIFENFFMDRYCKDVPTAKRKFGMKAVPIQERNWKTLWVGCPTAIGWLIAISKLSDFC